MRNKKHRLFNLRIALTHWKHRRRRRQELRAWIGDLL